MPHEASEGGTRSDIRLLQIKITGAQCSSSASRSDFMGMSSIVLGFASPRDIKQQRVKRLVSFV